MEKRREFEFVNDGEGLFERLMSALRLRRESPRVLLVDILAAALGFIFVRSPLVFGAHPLGAAYLSVLPGRVIAALIGVIIGAVTLGDGGAVLAMTGIIIVFLRIIISSSGRGGVGAVFGEGILLRMSVGVIGGFAVAVYEVLLLGFNITSVLYGITMVVAPPVISLAAAGVFEYGESTLRLFSVGAAKLRGSGDGRALYFKLSALVFIFLVSFSLRDYSALGISAPFIFTVLASLFTARSLGGVHGAAAGFVGALAVSGNYAGGFMLTGLVFGAFSGLGVLYSLIFAGAALSLFSAYVGGAIGLASVLPEYAVAAALSFPLLKKIKAPRMETADDGSERSAVDMIGTMALAYKNANHKLNSYRALEGVGAALRSYLVSEHTREELSSLVLSLIRRRLPYAENDENIEIIATKLYKKQEISPRDLAFLNLSADEEGELFSDISDTYSRLYTPSVPMADELLLLSRLIKEASAKNEAELSLNESATDALLDKLSSHGFSDFTARVFGSERRHVILAGRDPDGAIITSGELMRAIEESTGAVFAAPEYFRRGNMALMECSECERYGAVFATVGAPLSGSEVSGDVSRRIEADGRFYALISDGMGSGAMARRSAEFTYAFLSAVLPLSAPSDNLVHLLNSYLSESPDECSATLDLFELNLYNREAVFIKSGASPSYVKRGSSIFRIRSSTAPLGIMSSIDTEKIRVQVEVGDYVIMTSDGAHGPSDDAPWLIELIAAANPKSPSALAEAILRGAERHRRLELDDITVTVIQITENGCGA